MTRRSKPRIALVTPMLPVSHDQTRGRYIHETALSLSKLAPTKVFFQQLRYPNVPGLTPRSYLYGRIDANYSLPGLEIEAFKYPAIPVITRPLNGLTSAWVLQRRMRAFRPDVVLAYWVYPDGYASGLAARRLGVPCVVGALGSDIHVRDPMNALFTRRAIARADAVIVVSDAMRHTTLTRFCGTPQKVHTIVNGHNTTVFYPRPRAAVRARLGVAASARLIVYVGRFVEAKGMRELITAFVDLAASDKELQLALVGDGVMREELISKVQSAGLRDRVLFTGGLQPEAVAEWICASDLLCLPSWSEGYPNVVVEAIACGRPVVATDVGGTAEIVNPSNGVLVEPQSVTSLQSGLARALCENWDHHAIAAATSRTWDDVARETLAVCEQVIAGRASH